MVWWIASWADDEQYKGRAASEGEVFLSWCGVLLGKDSVLPLRLDELPPTVVASPIYRGPGPLPKY